MFKIRKVPIRGAAPRLPGYKSEVLLLHYTGCYINYITAYLSKKIYKKKEMASPPRVELGLKA